VEKAHPQVLNVLLQVLDDGHLTDGQGRTVDFSNVVIIMTSNLGAEFLLKGMDNTGRLSEDAKEKVMATVKHHFRPEFLNRLDDIVVFSPLSRSNLHEIVRMQVNSLAKRTEGRDIALKLDESAYDYVLAVAYDPIYGARPLRRYLEKNIVTQLSRMLLSGELPDNSTVTISAKNDRLNFNVMANNPVTSPSTSEQKNLRRS
jgi:ATP-dependent Clp protease ATP-binding subunit ClpB